ncbi:hypothetical protein ACJMK2_042812 [Sinanodonta woodiana]|uniref:Uncharacterized protein n=1 Tax=Sinanodonta woodiana TaxID=1069815 RepID=A0ABD3VUY9_SINWO
MYTVTSHSPFMLLLLSTVLSTEVLPDEQKLLNKLFNEQAYDNSVRPVYNSSRNVEVIFGFTLIQIMDMDEKNQVLTTNAWLDLTWKDERIHWDKDKYNGLEVVRLPAKKLWLPDVVLYNNADDYTDPFMSINAMVSYDGTIRWPPPVRFRSSCKVVITFFPFDSQECEMKFGSWTYDKAQVDLINKTAEVDVSSYYTNGEWMLTSFKIVRNEVIYPISDAIYPDVTIKLRIRRRILYYVLNILFPCFWLNILSVLTFCLPPDAGEKITLSITVLLSYSVFMLLVAESMPPTSEFVPLIGIYLTVSMATASVSVILTVLVLKLHHCSPHQRPIPHWVRRYVLSSLGRYVRCSIIPNFRKYFRTGKYLEPSEQSLANTTDHDDIQNQLAKKVESLIREHKSVFDDVNRNTGTQPKCVMSKMNDIQMNDNRINVDFRENTTTSSRSSNIDEEVFPKPDKTQTSSEEILKYLKILVAKNDERDAEGDIINEWKQVALVVDRMLFWIFLASTIFSSIIILVIVPAAHYSEKDGI